MGSDSIFKSKIVLASLGFGIFTVFAIKSFMPGTSDMETQTSPSSHRETLVPDPVSYESLKTPTDDSSGNRYAIEVGIYVDMNNLYEAKDLLETENMPFQILKIVDPSGVNWYVLAAGEYNSVDEAQRSKTKLESRLEITNNIITLPATVEN